MKKNIQLSLYLFFFFQIAILVFSFSYYRTFTLLQYINLSFYLSLLILLFSLTVYLIKTGFFDITHRAFRQLFVKKERLEENEKEWKPLSKMLTVNYFPMLFSGIFLFLCMVAALAYYYLI